MRYFFRTIQPSNIEWTEIENCIESTCFHTRHWCLYSNTIGYKSYVVEICSDVGHNVLGYFIGTRIWRGVWMITAPLEGTGTYTQGIILREKTIEQERLEIYVQMAKWLFETGIASYIQIDDWHLRRDSRCWIPYESFHHDLLESNGVSYTFRPTLYLDMKDRSIEELWSMQHYKSCKYSVNKARKLGLYVRRICDTKDIDSFVDIHYAQLVEVCARKGMKPKPSQHKNRMKALCRSLLPDRIILLECIGNDSFDKNNEVVMSSGIFCPGKTESIYWTGASYQKYQKYCPNELMVWEAICILHEMNAGGLNFGGMADYKLKFGTVYAYVPSIHFTKYECIYKIKMIAKRTYFKIRFMLSQIKKGKFFV